MNIDNNLLTQLFSNQGADASTGLEGGDVSIESGEFMELLGEAQNLADEGISLGEFSEGLEDGELNLSSEQKEVLKTVFSEAQVEEKVLPKEIDSILNTKKVGPKRSLFGKTEMVSNETIPKEVSNSENILPFKKQQSQVRIPISTQAGQLTKSTNLEGSKNAVTFQSSEDFVNQNKIFKKQNTSRSIFKVGNREELAEGLGEGLKNYVSEKNTISKSMIDPFKNAKPVMSFDKSAVFSQSELATDKPVEMTQAILAKVNGDVPEIFIQENNIDVADVEASGKTLKMSNISGVKNPQELIAKIANHIETLSIANKDQLDLKVEHHQLGKFDIQVSKIKGQNTIDLAIKSHSQEGAQFFAKHEAEMIKGLNDSGIKLSSVKLSESFTSSMKSFADSGSGSSKQSFSENSSNGRQFSFSESSDQRYNEDSDSKRRRDLWEMYKEKMGA